MLIIARRAGELIHIGDDIEIRIVDLSPSRVKIGVTAPRALSVLRGEVKRAAQQNQAASEIAATSLDKLFSQIRSSYQKPRR